jgi:hypothetical protein
LKRLNKQCNKLERGGFNLNINLKKYFQINTYIKVSIKKNNRKKREKNKERG